MPFNSKKPPLTTKSRSQSKITTLMTSPQSAKTKTSSSKQSKNYAKPYARQGR